MTQALKALAEWHEKQTHSLSLSGHESLRELGAFHKTAAQALRSLLSEREALREALEPMLKFASGIPDDVHDSALVWWKLNNLTMGYSVSFFRRARSALSPPTAPGGGG